MATTRILILAAAVLAWGQASAQSDQSDQAAQPAPRNRAIVYKCTGADGSVVFSESPCSTDPKKVQEIDTSGALRTGSGGHQRDIAASVADSDCRGRARESAYGSLATEMQASNDHIADYQQRQTTLAAQKVYASDGSGNLIDDPNAAQAIADLDNSIAQEREFQRKANANAEITYQNAVKVCDDQAAALEAQKKAQPQQENQGQQ